MKVWQEVRRWMTEIPAISVGLGAGDPAQFKAAMISAKLHPAHVNQTFTGCGFAAGALAATGGQNTRINALISPTGTPGEVLISTGVSSAQERRQGLRRCGGEDDSGYGRARR
jgi:2-dehydro-3-deoxy-phosphogluconate aldolase